MNRRQFIKAGVLSSLTFGLAGTGAVWLNTRSNDLPLTIEAVLAKLDELSKSTLVSSGEWSPSKILIHCAQSVEFSLTGFPEHKTDLFKLTAGHLAFSTFSSKGQMLHDLAEKIPGAPSIDDQANIHEAFNRFKKALLSFQQFKGKLAPHFAYGELSKQEYEIAHVMHFYNHLEELSV